MKRKDDIDGRRKRRGGEGVREVQVEGQAGSGVCVDRVNLGNVWHVWPSAWTTRTDRVDSGASRLYTLVHRVALTPMVFRFERGSPLFFVSFSGPCRFLSSVLLFRTFW